MRGTGFRKIELGGGSCRQLVTGEGARKGPFLSEYAIEKMVRSDIR